MSYTTPLAHNTHLYMMCGEEYAELGEGFDQFNKSMNPQVSTKQYINQSTPKHTVTANQPQWAYNAERVVGDTVNDYFASLEGKVGDDLKSSMVIYNDYDAATSGAYPAVKYDVLIAPASTGNLQGGETQTMSGTVYQNGDGVEGTFNPTTKTFTESSSASAASVQSEEAVTEGATV